MSIKLFSEILQFALNFCENFVSMPARTKMSTLNNILGAGDLGRLIYSVLCDAPIRLTSIQLLICAWVVGTFSWMGLISGKIKGTTLSVRIRALLMCVIFGPFGASLALGFAFFALIKLADEIFTDWTFPAKGGRSS